MDAKLQIILWCAAAVFLLILIKLFFTPLKFALRAAFKTIGGFIWLALINAVCACIGVTLGFNIANASVIGLLGLPGIVFLLLSRWALLL